MTETATSCTSKYLLVGVFLTALMSKEKRIGIAISRVIAFNTVFWVSSGLGKFIVIF